MPLNASTATAHLWAFPTTTPNTGLLSIAAVGLRSLFDAFAALSVEDRRKVTIGDLVNALKAVQSPDVDTDRLSVEACVAEWEEMARAIFESASPEQRDVTDGIEKALQFATKGRLQVSRLQVQQLTQSYAIIDCRLVFH
jgi:hypothetical protein